MERKTSAFQTPITIKEAIESVHKNNYVLPAIQREFVWTPDQIIKLFDSLMRDYPIGTFLFWDLEKDRLKDFKFYEFIRNYHEKNNTHNPKANLTGEDDITAILDGQQRFTALYLALKGTYAYKIPRMYWANDEAFPIRKFYLNLLSKSNEFDQLYDFRFLTEQEAEQNDDNNFWFEVGKVMEFENLRDVIKLLRDNNLLQSEYAEQCLSNLYEIINKKQVINYYLEVSQELDKVLNIFIRVNSGGTKLSYSDLLLSIATAQWDKKDAREEINFLVDDLNSLGDEFKFDKDFVLKSSLVLSDINDIAFKVDNFDSNNMDKIEKNWDDIKIALKMAVKLISSYGFNYQTLTSNNAVIPIAYYIFKKGNPSNFCLSNEYSEDRKTIKRWLTISLLKRAFGGQSDSVLKNLRTILQKNHKNFPYEEIEKQFKGSNKSIIFTDDDIDNLLSYKYGQSYTFSVLSLIYPNLDLKNTFHQDHIFPKSLFNKKYLIKNGITNNEEQSIYFEKVNFIGNIQLLEGLPNIEKSDKEFENWFNEIYKSEDEKKEYMRKNYIPENISLEFNNFVEFYEEREKLIRNKLNQVLLNG